MTVSPYLKKLTCIAHYSKYLCSISCFMSMPCFSRSSLWAKAQSTGSAGVSAHGVLSLSAIKIFSVSLVGGTCRGVSCVSRRVWRPPGSSRTCRCSTFLCQRLTWRWLNPSTAMSASSSQQLRWGHWVLCRLKILTGHPFQAESSNLRWILNCSRLTDDTTWLKHQLDLKRHESLICQDTLFKGNSDHFQPYLHLPELGI